MTTYHTNTQDLRIIDALGSFVEKTEHGPINWSKVNFSDLERENRIPIEVQERIVQRFDHFTDRVAGLGYNALSFDDLAHLVCLPIYNPGLQELLQDYHHLYKRLFTIAKEKHLRLFINTDYLFYNKDIHLYLEKETLPALAFFQQVVRAVFKEFPELEGVILRIGENDGKDVRGSFLSQLQIRTRKQARQLLKEILPVFEESDKTLIFRTWTVGVYGIGDLIWNEKTFNAVFGDIDSDALIISMKYGDTDFMRYLTLNPLFFTSPHKKIIELQTRREWEGMGMYPSFVGWDYARYLKQLENNRTIVGVHVWCQTGGWAKKEWSNVTYLENSSFWNELNTEVTIALVTHESVEDAVTRFCANRRITNVESFLELLRLSDIALKKGLYLPELAKKNLYFRRSRIPPLIWLTWDRILLSDVVVWLHRSLVDMLDIAVQDGNEAVIAAKKMVALANELNLDAEVMESLEFEHATLKLFAQLRRYLLIGMDEKELSQLAKQTREYETTYPQHYDIPHVVGAKPPNRLFRSSLNLFVRESLQYRKRDRIILKTSTVQARAIRYYLRRSKSHLADQSMGFESFFK